MKMFRLKLLCRLVLGYFFVSVVQCIPVQRFYPFGPENGDNQLPRSTHESYSSEIQLRVPVKFYSETYPSLFVSTTLLILHFSNV